MAKESDDPVIAELVAIKRLLAFTLLTSGASQIEVAGALGISQSQVSRMFPGVRRATRPGHDVIKE